MGKQSICKTELIMITRNDKVKIWILTKWCHFTGPYTWTWHATKVSILLLGPMCQVTLFSDTWLLLNMMSTARHDRLVYCRKLNSSEVRELVMQCKWSIHMNHCCSSTYTSKNIGGLMKSLPFSEQVYMYIHWCKLFKIKLH